MADKIAVLEKQLKALQTKAKGFTPAIGDKLKKQTISAVEVTWGFEDEFTQAVEAAKKRGMEGSKPADFAKDKDCSVALAKFKKAAQKHAKDSHSLHQFCDGARDLGKEFTKLGLSAEKEQKAIKDKKSAQWKSVETMLAAIKKEGAALKKVSEIPGTMTMPQLHYGKSFEKVLDRIFKKVKDGKGAADLDKILEEREAVKNHRSAKKLATQSNKLFDTAASATDLKAAAPDLRKADALFKKLDGLNKDYAAALKKHGKALKADKEKAKLLKLIAEIGKLTGVITKKRAATLKKWSAK